MPQGNTIMSAWSRLLGTTYVVLNDDLHALLTAIRALQSDDPMIWRPAISRKNSDLRCERGPVRVLRAN